MIVKCVFCLKFDIFCFPYITSMEVHSHVMNKHGLKIMGHLVMFFDQGFYQNLARKCSGVPYSPRAIPDLFLS